MMEHNKSVRLTEPILIYTVRSNNDANLLVALLTDAGVAAFAVDDVSTGGLFAMGTLGYLHRPQVFVEKTQAERAAEFITRFEEKEERQDAEDFCYCCGAFIPNQVPQCPHCTQSLDWED